MRTTPVRWLPFILVLFAWCLPLATAAYGVGDFTAICYHDVRTVTQGDLSHDQYALDTEHLLGEFEWLSANGYHPVSVDDIERAKSGEKPLPEKAILLTFDDGYISFYTDIYPLLRLYNFPAVFAIVGEWLTVPAGEDVLYDNRLIPRDKFLTWRQLREMQDSGLVEIASHSYALHKGILANPQGNMQPSAITRFYKGDGSYESDKHFKDRIRADLDKNSQLIHKHLGKRPRIIVWPYGAYSIETSEIADSLGMSINFTLEEDTPNSIQHDGVIHRELIMANPATGDFVYMLNRKRRPEPIRMVHVDLDYVYDDNPAQQNRNIDRLLDRIKGFSINTVYLQAFADPDGDGDVTELYFPNRHLPMRADLFNRVAWQLRTRAGVNVYAWMPVLAFDLGNETYHSLGVQEYKEGKIRPSTASYKRLSPFHPKARKIINEIYADLARYTKFYGLIFHDDAYFTDFEDFSPSALTWYKGHGFDLSPEEIRASPEAIQSFAELKTDFLIDFTHELADTVRYYQPDIKTARNMYALPVLQPESEQWFAQNLEKFVRHYDTTAIMAMPYMEKAENPAQWLESLVTAVQQRIPAYDPKNPAQANQDKILFELQAMDWNRGTYLPSSVLASQMRYLLINGINHIGYYPDDFHGNRPDQKILNTIFSLKTFPYRRH